MNVRIIIGVLAGLSWAPVEALVHLARPMPPLQVAALALLGAGVVVGLVTTLRGGSILHPWQQPAAILGLAALGAGGVQLASGAFIWSTSASSWLALAALALGPLSLTAWAWQAGARTGVFVLAAGAVLIGGRLI